MVATCCKPSSGAGVVWVNMKYREVWVTPDHEKGDCFKEVPCAYVQTFVSCFFCFIPQNLKEGPFLQSKLQ